MGKRESTASSPAQLLRGAVAAYEKRRKKTDPKAAIESADRALVASEFRESRAMRVIEAAAAPAKGELPRVRVVLIDEGLGNRRNMNYYGPEAIASAVKVFEGKPSFTNHPSESEEEDLPERDVMRQYGFYKDLEVKKLKNKEGKEVAACVGWLHFDLSELGRQMYCKALTALEYQKQFPDSGEQYIGWSVLGGGRGEERTIDPKEDATGTLAEFDEPVEVNYVTQFVEGESCDAVTRAGRGGRVLAVAEDANGRTKEDGMITKLKATHKKVTEAAKKATGEDKKLLEASAKELAAAIEAVEADAAAAEEADPFEAMCAKREDESDEDHKARMADMAKKLSKHLNPAAEGEPDGDEEPAKKPDADSMEAKRDALKAYAKEAGVPEGAYTDAKFDRLSRLPYREARSLIDDDAKLAEASRKEIVKELDTPVAILRPGAREGAAAGAGSSARNTAAFKESFSQEE